MSGDATKFVSPVYATLFFLLCLLITLLSLWKANSASATYGLVGGREPSAPSTKINLWAWEHDEDLSFIDPTKVSVSYFAGMIYVRGANITLRPRTQKLKLLKNTQTVPVFRIETLRGVGMPAALQSPGALQSRAACAPDLAATGYVVKAIVSRVKELPPSNMVQLDFDALEDERPFYTSILQKLRRELPSGSKISITALSSWLLEDRWLKNGDADEVVAMLFSIGADKKNILNRIQRQPLDSGTDAEMALGISSNESDTNKSIFAAHLQNQLGKVYIFSSHPWTKDRLRSITQEAFQK